MLAQKNKTQVVIGKDLALLTSAQTRADLVAGKIGIFKNGSSTASTTALVAGDRFKVVYMNTSGNIIESPMYDYDLITNKQNAAYAASTEQKTYVGYNGSTGSITATNSGIYYMHLERKDWSATWGEHGSFKLAGAYEADATATETEIADALAVNIAKTFEVERAKSGFTVTKTGRINSAAVTAANALDNDATVVNNVNAFTVATSLAYNTGAGTLAVGDYVRIGTVGGGTTLTSDVYKVTAINGLVVTVDRKIVDASGTYAAATADLEVIPNATAIAANWGLYFESEPVHFVPGLFKFQNVTFQVTLSDAFGSTLITDGVKAFKGSGTYPEVAEIEWELQGNRGEGYKVASFPVNTVLNATLGKTYNMISIDFMNDNARTLDGKAYSFFSLLIATEVDSSSTVNADLKTVFGL